MHAIGTLWMLRNKIQDLIDANIVEIRSNNEVIVDMPFLMHFKRKNPITESQMLVVACA